jgi:uncharacterized protein with PQ loop repeat
VHYQDMQSNSAAVKRKLAILYCSIYACFVSFFVYQDIFLYEPLILIFTNGSIWLPQIHRNYRVNKKTHIAPLSFFMGLSMSQSFLILYIYGCPSNFLQKQTNYPFVGFFIIYQSCQLLVLYYQKLWGARFFVPLSWRLDPNAHNYFCKIGRPKNDPESAEEENVECVICMNKIIWEVEDGTCVVAGPGRQQSEIEL